STIAKLTVTIAALAAIAPLAQAATSPSATILTASSGGAMVPREGISGPAIRALADRTVWAPERRIGPAYHMCTGQEFDYYLRRLPQSQMKQIRAALNALQPGPLMDPPNGPGCADGGGSKLSAFKGGEEIVFSQSFACQSQELKDP